MKKFLAISGILLGYFLFFQAQVWCGEYTITQLTNNNYDDSAARIHNGQIVWEGLVPREGSTVRDVEIFLYDGTQVRQFTDNDYSDRYPRIYNGQIVWQQGSKILFYDGSKIIQIGTGSNPEIQDGQVTWFAWDGNDYEIFLYDGIKTTQLTDNYYNDQYPQIYNGQVTWLGYDGHDYEIFFYDGTQTLQLTNDDYNCWKPQINNGQVVWQGYVGNNWEIYYYDGILTRQLTDTVYRQQSPQINNGQIVWEGLDGHDSEIFFFDGEKIIKVTDNSYDDYRPQVDGGRIVWEGFNEMYWTWGIFLYDGGKIFQLTNERDNNHDPFIHKDRIVWSGTPFYSIDRSFDWEIFLAKIKSDSVTLLDGSEFSAGTEISGDPEKLVAQEGTIMQGVVADGVTRLLLKADVSSPSQMTVSIENPSNEREDGVFRSIDGLYEGSSITVNSTATSKGEKAFCIYQAPEDFVRLAYANEDKKASERKVVFKVKTVPFSNSTSRESLVECRILRPPVVLVHGLWSNPGDWTDFAGSLQLSLPGINIICADYEKNNARSIDINKGVVRGYIAGIDSDTESAKSKLRAEKIAMVQADVIGHSMGGLLARIYAGSRDSNFYKRNNNFRTGDIHKLITIDSPHYGSFLADIAINQILNGPITQGRIEALILFNIILKQPIDQGAVEDLMTTSQPIVDMNSKNINTPTHIFAGDYYVRDENLNNIETPELRRLHKFLNSRDYNTKPYIVNQESDLIVSLLSQIGGVASSGVDTFSNLDHLNVISFVNGAIVVEKTVDLLNMPTDDFSFRKGFK